MKLGVLAVISVDRAPVPQLTLLVAVSYTLPRLAAWLTDPVVFTVTYFTAPGAGVHLLMLQPYYILVETVCAMVLA